MSMEAALTSTVGLIPIVLATGAVIWVTKEAAAISKRRASGEDVRKYPEYFQESYLDNWYKIDRRSFSEAFRENYGKGADMVAWNEKRNPELHEKIFNRSLGES